MTFDKILVDYATKSYELGKLEAELYEQFVASKGKPNHSYWADKYDAVSCALHVLEVAARSENLDALSEMFAYIFGD